MLVIQLVVHCTGLRSGATVPRVAGMCVCDSCAQRCAMAGGRQCVGRVHDCRNSRLHLAQLGAHHHLGTREAARAVLAAVCVRDGIYATYSVGGGRRACGGGGRGAHSTFLLIIIFYFILSPLRNATPAPLGHGLWTATGRGMAAQEAVKSSKTRLQTCCQWGCVRGLIFLNHQKTCQCAG